MKPKRFKLGIKDSIFGKDCLIAKEVNIYQATFGDKCFVGPWVEVQKNTIIGNNVRIQSHTLICEGMRIGDNVFIGHGVITTNSRHPKSGAVEWVCEPPVLGSEVSIGSNVTILPGVVIGDGAIIGAGAIVTKNVPANKIIIGNNKILNK